MSVHDLYALSANDTEAATTLVSALLGVNFIGHNSHFFGDYDLAVLSDEKSSIRLQPNLNPGFEEGIDPPEEQFMEHHFADQPILLYVDVAELAEAERLKGSLLLHSSTITLLKREQVEP